MVITLLDNIGKRMDLETPKEGDCLLCGDETVEYSLNKRDNPMFHCTTFGTVVNTRPRDDRAETLLSEAVETDADSEELEEPEPESADTGTEPEPEPESTGTDDGEQTLTDLLGGGSDE